MIRRLIFFLAGLLTIIVPLSTRLSSASGADASFHQAWSFAVITDLHIGREYGDYDGAGYNDSGTPVSGAAAGYAREAVKQINKLASSQNIVFVAVLGDLTEAAEASELRAAKLILDGLSVPWIPIPGNHDTWPMTDTSVAPARNPPPDSYFDGVMQTVYSRLSSTMAGWGRETPSLIYDPEVGRDAYFENFFFDCGGFHFVGLDFNKDGYRTSDLHNFTGGTWAWFREHMKQYVQRKPERSKDVILLSHHPMTSDDQMTFSSAEIQEITRFANTYYSYRDSLGNTRTKTYGSRIWGQLAGHTHPWKLRLDYPGWSGGGPVLAYPRNFGGVSIGIVTVTSATPTGVGYSSPTVITQAASGISVNSATLNGYLASLGSGSSAQVYFEWGTAGSYGNKTPVQTMNGTGSFNATIKGLRTGTAYSCRACAINGGLVSRGNNQVLTISGFDITAPARPSLLYPSSGAHITDSTPWLDWNSVTDASPVHYQLKVDNNADFSSPIVNKTWLTGSSYTVSSALADGTYYWKVRAVDAAGNASGWTGARYFVLT